MASNPATFDHEAESPSRFSQEKTAQERHRALLLRLRQSLHLFCTDPSLAACIYIVFHCPSCGEVRQARADYPDLVAAGGAGGGTACGFFCVGRRASWEESGLTR